MNNILQLSKSILILVTLGVLAAGCGGEGEQGAQSTRRIVGGTVITPNSIPKSETIQTDGTVVATNGLMFASDGPIQTVKLPEPYSSLCSTETAITWTFASSSSLATIDNPTACSPKILLANGYDGTNSLSAVLKLSDKVINYRIDIKKYNPATSACQLSNGTNGQVLNDQCVAVVCAKDLTDKCLRASYEVDARNDAQATMNAKAICQEKKLTYMDHSAIQNSIRCGGTYTLSNWNGSSFVAKNEFICAVGSVKVINQVRCY